MCSKMSIQEVKFHWSRQNVLKLIELYEQNPILYRVNLPDYKNKSVRNAVLEQIQQALSEYSTKPLSVDDIAKKIHGIRTQYCKELKKKEKSQSANADPLNPYTPKLWFFNKCQFLQDLNPEITNVSSLEDVKIEEDVDSVDTDDQLIFEGAFDELANDRVMSPHLSTSADNTQSRKRKSTNELTSHVMPSKAEYCGNVDDDLNAYGKNIVHELQHIKDPKRLRKLKRVIFNTILDAQEEEEELL